MAILDNKSVHPLDSKKRDVNRSKVERTYFKDQPDPREGRLGPVDFFNYNFPTNHFWFKLLGPFVKLFFKTGWKIDYQGLANVPKDNNFVIMPNHVSHFDAPLAVVGLWPRKMLNVIADEKLFYNKYLRLLARLFNAFPVRKNSKNMDIVEYAQKRINMGNNMFWFPEGQRHKNPSINKCNPGKLGSGLIAHKVDADIIPVFISGAEFAMPVGRKLRYGKGLRSIKIQVRYGKPVPLDDLRALPESKETSKLIVERIISKIEELRPVGPYRDQSHR